MMAVFLTLEVVRRKQTPDPPPAQDPSANVDTVASGTQGSTGFFQGLVPRQTLGVLTFGQTWPWVRRDFLLWIKIIFIFS